ncbi:MAG: hypothetical protein U0807_08320 [Candidatus Binatia bacterium]
MVAVSRAAALAGLLVAAGSAGACPVCFDASNPQALWFYWMSTLMLTLLPFGVFGLLALVAFRLRHDAEPIAAPEPAVVLAPEPERC